MRVIGNHLTTMAVSQTPGVQVIGTCGSCWLQTMNPSVEPFAQMVPDFVREEAVFSSVVSSFSQHGDNMNRKNLVSAVACVSMLASIAATAQAQTNVQIFGLMDLGVERVNNFGATASSSITRMQFGTVPSRLGFRGTEDLGGGLQATFNLEMGINSDAGTLMNAGRAFGRNSTVGLSGPWGSVTAGRQLTHLATSMANSDLMGPGAYGLGSLDSYLPNVRADNSISYRGTFSGLTVGAMYSVGRDVANTNSPGGTNCAGEIAGNSQACKTVSVVLKYDAAAWGVAFGSDRIHGGPGAFGGLTSSEKNDTRSTINGYMQFGPAKLTAGLLRRNNDGDSAVPRSDILWVGGSYTTGPWVLEAQLNRLNFKNSPSDANLIALRTTYLLSKRTAVYATAGHIKNSGTLSRTVNGFPGLTTAPGGSQSGIMAGVRHVF